MGFEGVIGLASASLIGVTSIDSPCSQDWAAWVATEGTSSNAELEMGIAAAWASRARNLGNSGASVLLGFFPDAACCAHFLPTGR